MNVNIYSETLLNDFWSEYCAFLFDMLSTGNFRTLTYCIIDKSEVYISKTISFIKEMRWWQRYKHFAIDGEDDNSVNDDFDEGEDDEENNDNDDHDEDDVNDLNFVPKRVTEDCMITVYVL